MKPVANGVDSYRDAARFAMRTLVFGGSECAPVLNSLLGEHSYAFAVIGDSKPTAEILIENSFEQLSAVIIDSEVPAAVDLCRRLRSAAATSQIPVVILCRNQPPAPVEKWIDAGADDLIDWPSAPDLVRKRIENLVDLADLRRSLNEIAQEGAREESGRDEFLDNSADVIYRLDLSRRLISVNKAAEALTGYTREELFRDGFSQIVPHQHMQTMEKMLESKLEGSPQSTYEIEIVAKDGSRKTLEINSRLVHRDGRPVGIQGIARDVTDRRRTEAALRFSEHRYRELVDNTREWICMHDLEGRLVFINKGASQMLGYEPKELEGSSIRDLIHPRYQEEFDLYLERIKANGADEGFLTLMTREGSARVLAYNNILGADGPGGPLVRGIAHDVTELKRIERELRQRERQFRAVFESALDAVLILDDAGELVRVNPAASKLLNLPEEDLVGRPATDFILLNEPDINTWDELLKKYGAKGEIKIRPATGAVLTVEYSATPSFLPGRHLAILRDLTDRRTMELAIQESNRFMGSLLEYSPAIIYVVGKDGRYRVVNQNWERTVGRSREDILGQRREDIWPAELAGQWSKDDRTVIETGTPLATEEYVETPVGPCYLYTVRFPLADSEGQVEAVTGISIDITGRKRAEDALAASEARFKRTFEHAAVGMALTLADGRFIEVNEAFCETTGYTEEELLSINMVELTHPDDRAACLEMIEELVKRKTQAFHIEKRYIKKGGDIVWVRNSNSLISDGSGGPATIATLTQDVTNWKLAEVALKESEKRFQSLAEISPVGIFYADTMGRSIYVNERFCEISGLPPEQIRGRDWTSVLPPEDRERAQEQWRIATAEGTRFEREVRFVRPDGFVTWAFGQAVAETDASGQTVGYIGTITDISERKLAEVALKKSEERFRTLIENSYDIIAVLGRDGRATYLSPSFKRILGYSPHEVAGVHPMELTHPDDVQTLKDKLQDGLALKEQSTPIEFRLRHRDGSYRYMEVTGTNLLEDPDIAGIVVNARDITERRQIEEMIYRLASIVESSDDGVISTTIEGHVTSWNRGAQKVYGYTAEEMIGRSVSVLIPVDQPDELRQLHERISRGETIAKYETARIRKDGARIIVSLTLSPVKDGRGRVSSVSGIVRDVTDSTRLQEQLRQAQKMEAIGRLAGGVAHDFNNLLTAINGYSELTLMRLSDNDPLREGILEIRKAGDRAASLTRQLLAFSRKQILQPAVIDLNSVIGEMNKMLRRLIGEDVELVTELDPEIGCVKADRGQVEQIIVNLVVNSRDAMPDGGSLVIGTANITNKAQTGSLQPVGIPSGDFVKVTVADTGCGMDAETLSRVFEPFFTTKGPGKGTGLGLATVYGIVKQSGGYIDVDSLPGKGTCFSICLPRVVEETTSVPGIRTPNPVPRGNETVLLIEDEEMVRKLASQTLKMNGYDVLEARHGGEALLLCELHKGKIHLMLTDVVMPQMSGRQLADRLRPLHPEMKVIYMSGYTDDVVLQAGLGAEFAFIQKPFLPDALARKVREVLDSLISDQTEP